MVQHSDKDGVIDIGLIISKTVLSNGANSEEGPEQIRVYMGRVWKWVTRIVQDKMDDKTMKEINVRWQFLFLKFLWFSDGMDSLPMQNNSSLQEKLKNELAISHVLGDIPYQIED